MSISISGGTSAASTASIDASNGVGLATWSTSARPAGPVAGQMGYNTTLGVVETWTGSAWSSLSNLTTNLNFAAGTNGITFNNTNTTASPTSTTLNDYETGTWNPNDGSGANLSLTVVSASYTKIGRLVYAWCYVNYPVTASSATATIGGFPFTQSPASTYAHGTARSNGVSTLMQIQMNSAATNAIFFTAGGVNATNANISNNYLVFSIVYQATF